MQWGHKSPSPVSHYKSRTRLRQVGGVLPRCRWTCQSGYISLYHGNSSVHTQTCGRQAGWVSFNKNVNLNCQISVSSSSKRAEHVLSVPRRTCTSAVLPMDSGSRPAVYLYGVGVIPLAARPTALRDRARDPTWKLTVDI